MTQEFVEIEYKYVEQCKVTFNPSPKEEISNVEVRTSSSGNKAVFAVRDIKKRQEIARFEPLSTFKKVPGVPEGAEIAVWAGRMRQQDSDVLGTIIQLYDLYPRSLNAVGIAELLEKKLSLNAFKLLKGGLAVYKTLSFVNHSCEPNSVNFDGILLATRDIAKGEEITICYSNLEDPMERKKLLAAKYGFACCCPICVKLPNVRVTEKCVVCGWNSTKTMFCGRCKKVHYCSKECQQKDWEKHKKTCCFKTIEMSQ